MIVFISESKTLFGSAKQLPYRIFLDRWNGIEYDYPYWPTRILHFIETFFYLGYFSVFLIKKCRVGKRAAMISRATQKLTARLPTILVVLLDMMK